MYVVMTKEKVYICLFTCATSPAIHVEVVKDLSRDSIWTIHCLPQIYLTGSCRCNSSYNPNVSLRERWCTMAIYPKVSPLVWWERLIGLTKLSLKKVLEISLAILQTLVVEIEATLNVRPLTRSG